MGDGVGNLLDVIYENIYTPVLATRLIFIFQYASKHIMCKLNQISTKAKQANQLTIIKYISEAIVMKTFIRQMNDTKNYCDGYALVEVDIDGSETIKAIKSKAKQTAGNYCYRLPDNELGIKWLSDKKICDGYELTYSKTIHNQTTAQQSTVNKQPRKTELDRLKEVLDEEDRAVLDALINKAIAKLKKIQLQEQIAALQAQLAQYEQQ